MPENATARVVTNARLTLSRAPAAELAAGAVKALTALKAAAGKRTPPGADYVLVAVPPGTADDELAAELERAADAHIAAAATP